MVWYATNRLVLRTTRHNSTFANRLPRRLPTLIGFDVCGGMPVVRKWGRRKAAAGGWPGWARPHPSRALARPLTRVLPGGSTELGVGWVSVPAANAGTLTSPKLNMENSQPSVDPVPDASSFFK